MGRGRAKAKQTKVARRLKYATGDLDVDALTAELGTGTGGEDDEPDSDVVDGFDPDGDELDDEAAGRGRRQA